MHFLVLIENINPGKTLRYPQKIPGQNKYVCPAYKISTQDYMTLKHPILTRGVGNI